MNLDIHTLLTFLDNPATGDNSHASAINGVIGEDLNAAVFGHYLEKGGACTVDILPKSPSLGTRKGRRLDRWIYAIGRSRRREVLFQCEIKNWAASALGAKKLPIDCSRDEQKKVTEHHWNQQARSVFRSEKHPNIVTKVLLPMKIPEKYACIEVQPLIIYWMPILNPNNKSQCPFFKTSLKDLGLSDSFPSSQFSCLNFFSVSLYLRQLLKDGTETLCLSMPNAERRVEVLSKISVSR